jgi:hypothetical protein
MALVNYLGTNIITVALEKLNKVTLMPGINEVDNAEFEKMVQNPSFNERIKNGKIIVLDDGKSQVNRTAADMINLIPKIYDVKLLQKIIKTDGRDDVVKAAKQQMDLLKVKPDDKKVEKSDVEHFN